MNKISALSPGLAREYSSGSTYEAGQYVLWQNAYWKCKTAITTAEPWTQSHWEKDDSPLDHKADLVDGKVPAAQLPSYVDDVVEGYYYEGAFYEDQGHSEAIVPEESKIYVDKSPEGGSKCYRWSGSVYVEISPAPDLSAYYTKTETDALLADNVQHVWSNVPSVPNRFVDGNRQYGFAARTWTRSDTGESYDYAGLDTSTGLHTWYTQGRAKKLTYSPSSGEVKSDGYTIATLAAGLNLWTAKIAPIELEGGKVFTYTGTPSYHIIGTFAFLSDIPSVPVKSVNGKTDTVVLTGADIAVSGTNDTKISAALADKLDKSGGEASDFRILLGNTGGGQYEWSFRVVDGGNYGKALVLGKRIAGSSDSWEDGRGYLLPNPDAAGSSTLALLSDIDSAVKAAVQQIAPTWVSRTEYAQDALVTYDGVVYRCKADTVSPHTATPKADAAHWEAKPVSDLFLPLSGGTVTGPLRIAANQPIIIGDYALVKTSTGVEFNDLTDKEVHIPINRSGSHTVAFAASPSTSDNLAALDSDGNPTDSGIPKVNIALESVPNREIAASTAYAVGDVLRDGGGLGDPGKAYRCKLAYTSAANPVSPSSDTTHWGEVPVLKAVDEQLAGKATKADATLTSAVGAWSFSDGSTHVIRPVSRENAFGGLEYSYYVTGAGDIRYDPQTWFNTEEERDTAAKFTWDIYESDGEEEVKTGTLVATRAVAYQLGSQTGKLLASEAEVEALRTALAGRSYDLSDAAGVVRALEDIIAALGGEVQQ